MTPLLSVDSVGKSFQDRRVLSAASLDVPAGAITFLAGRNGAGKSTLLKICAGWLAPDYGTIRFDGEDHPRVQPHRMARQGVFYLPAGSLLSPSFTLRRHFVAVAERFGTSGVQETAELLGLSQLLEAVPAILSGGERRRAGIALALIRAPRCLLADEPLRGVSPKDTEIIITALRSLANAGCGVLMIGHEIPSLLPAADRVVWITAGTTYQLATPAEAERNPQFRREFLGREEFVDRGTPPVPVPVRQSPTGSSAAVGQSARRATLSTLDHCQTNHPIHIDAQTFRELEIFEAQPGGTSLFHMLNRTCTSGGRARLHQHFLKPPSDPNEIAETQRAVRFVLEHTVTFASLPNEERLKEIDRYRRSSYVTSRHSNSVALRVESLWYKLRHDELFGALERGVTATLDFLHSTQELARGIQAMNPPPIITGIADKIAQATIGEPMPWSRADPQKRALSADKVLLYDRVIRDQLRSHIDCVIESLYELDRLRSLASATREWGFVFPRIHTSESPMLQIEGVYHPFVSGALRNHFNLAARKRILFLTGPNMAGKTTYMKACALCVYMAHLGMGVPAYAMEFSPFDALFSSINTVDNIRQGYSYFYSEIRRVKDAAQLLREGKQTFVVFDEIFKGTNVQDAFEASRAVIKGFAGLAPGVFVISSHLAELVQDLATLDSMQFQYFDAEIRDGQLAYDYRLKDGSSSQRLGMILLKQEGVLNLLEG